MDANLIGVLAGAAIAALGGGGVAWLNHLGEASRARETETRAELAALRLDRRNALVELLEQTNGFMAAAAEVAARARQADHMADALGKLTDIHYRMAATMLRLDVLWPTDEDAELDRATNHLNQVIANVVEAVTQRSVTPAQWEEIAVAMHDACTTVIRKARPYIGMDGAQVRGKSA